MPYKSYPDADCGTDSVSAPFPGSGRVLVLGVDRNSPAQAAAHHSLKVGVQDSSLTQPNTQAAHKCLFSSWWPFHILLH